ncbi:hypothetical protein IW262DRAFT_1296967 [Armillaria fumosa]|nr:hypothetical protein IW262DRAFT_1296967 [Armillaria fumosa]
MTYGNKHYATVLVALNTSCEGGSVLLRHNEQEMTMDMHPKTSLRAAALSADVEHKVVSVTGEVWLILQYDVFICQGEGYSRDFGDSWNLDKVLSKLRLHYSNNKIYTHELRAPSSSSNEDSICGIEEIGFPLCHLDRQASVCKEYLRGADAVIYAKLSTVFDGYIVSVILEEISIEGEWTGEEMAVHKAGWVMTRSRLGAGTLEEKMSIRKNRSKAIREKKKNNMNLCENKLDDDAVERAYTADICIETS